MKRIAFLRVLVLLTIIKPINAQSEAGAVFLLISPGARAGGMGEAQVAVANDVYASYWNPAGTISYSALLSKNSSLGINAKISYQHLVELGAGNEQGKGTSTDFGFDIGYLRKEFLNPNLNLGLTMTNIGPKVSFIFCTFDFLLPNFKPTLPPLLNFVFFCVILETFPRAGPTDFLTLILPSSRKPLVYLSVVLIISSLCF